MKQLDGDNDQRLLGRFALSLLAEINGAPLGTTAHGIDGGEVERMARNARADGRQAGRRRAVAALVDDRVKADIRDERPRIGEACERAEFAEQVWRPSEGRCPGWFAATRRRRAQCLARWVGTVPSRRGRPRQSRW